MGLKDVAALAEVVVDAARLGIDPGQADVLDRYQRWRRFDTMAMGLATNSLNFLFSNESTLLRTVRDIGLGLVDRAPPLKKPVHPPGRGIVRRSAAAVEGRGVVGRYEIYRRLCEEQSDEAIIYPLCRAMDCFASLAMTGRGRSRLSLDLPRLFRQHDRDAVAESG
jgi:hypothetical protein